MFHVEFNLQAVLTKLTFEGRKLITPWNHEEDLHVAWVLLAFYYFRGIISWKISWKWLFLLQTIFIFGVYSRSKYNQSDILCINDLSHFISPSQHPHCTSQPHCAALAGTVLIMLVSRQLSHKGKLLQSSFSWPSPACLRALYRLRESHHGLSAEMRFLGKVAGSSPWEGEGLSDPAGPLYRAAASLNEELVGLFQQTPRNTQLIQYGSL